MQNSKNKIKKNKYDESALYILNMKSKTSIMNAHTIIKGKFRQKKIYI